MEVSQGVVIVKGWLVVSGVRDWFWLSRWLVWWVMTTCRGLNALVVSIRCLV